VNLAAGAAYNAGPGAVQKYGGVPAYGRNQKLIEGSLPGLFDRNDLKFLKYLKNISCRYYPPFRACALRNLNSQLPCSFPERQQVVFYDRRAIRKIRSIRMFSTQFKTIALATGVSLAALSSAAFGQDEARILLGELT